MSFFENLIITKYKQQILKTIETNNVTIIKGPTGCGKSTFIPYILSNKKIIIIEPRRIAVKALYNSLKNYIDIGYKMRFEYQNLKANVLIMTDGMFLNYISNNKITQNNNFIQTNAIDYIIVDEVHERTLRIDLIMALCKNMKLILMSATVNTENLRKYFGAAVMNIEGKKFNAEIKYLKESCSDYVIESFLKVKEIIGVENFKKSIANEVDDIFNEQNFEAIKEITIDVKKNSDEINSKGESTVAKDILIFLPGEEDINSLYKLIRKLPQCLPFKIFANSSNHDKIFVSSNLTKVIISTNICETSLTIPGIKYVIDCGLNKEKIYDKISYFGIKKITYESAEQRKGRCNRLNDGICYRLFTADEKFNKFVPEIMKNELSYAILLLTRMGVDIFKFDFLDAPRKENIKDAIKYLINIDCIEFSSAFDQNNINVDETENKNYIKPLKITKYGVKVLQNPLDVHLSHFLEQCKKRKVEHLGSAIISLISQENYNFIDRSNKKCNSDLEALLFIFYEYRQTDDKIGFCKKFNVNIKGMEKSQMIYKQICKKEKFNLQNKIKQFREIFDENEHYEREDASFYSEDEFTELEKVFIFCFKHNLAQRQNDNSYLLKRCNINVFIHPSSNFFKKRDKNIVFVDAFSTTKNYARIVHRYIN